MGHPVHTFFSASRDNEIARLKNVNSKALSDNAELQKQLREGVKKNAKSWGKVVRQLSLIALHCKEMRYVVRKLVMAPYPKIL